MRGSSSGGLPPPPLPPGTPAQALARDIFGNEIGDPQSQPPLGGPGPGQPASEKPAREKATDAIGRRAGALLDEIDFPAFVASLVNGTFDAIVNSSIRQMETYADLVAAVAKPLDQFTQENVTHNQARDWLAEQYPADIELQDVGGSFQLAPVAKPDDDAEAPSWLTDFGQEGADLSPEFLEETLLPLARERVAQQRLSTLSTMVLTGINRVVVQDGTVGARLRFRASAADTATVQYSTSNDPSTGATEWGRRGTERQAVTKVSTVDVNAQSDSELEARLYGDVKINFASETVPLDRFVDQAQQTLLERHSRLRQLQQRAAAPQPAPPQPALQPQPAPQAPQPPAPTATIAPPPATGGAT